MPQTQTEQQAAGHREREHFFGSAKIVALLTVGSRILGMFRDMTILWLGANWQTEAFQFAFQLPQLFRRLFGEGALSAAFVPVFTEMSEKDGPDKARKLLANSMGLLAALMMTLMVVIGAAVLLWLWLSPEHRQDRQFLAMLTWIMLPYMVFVCTLALASAALNCRGHFIYPAFAPIILNVCMIAADGVAMIFWGKAARYEQLVTISASVTVAGVIQLGGVLWLLRRAGMGWAPSLRPIQEGVGRMLKLMAPALVVFGFLQFASFFDSAACLFFSRNQFSDHFTILGMQFPRPLAEGSLVRLTAAQRLYQLPMGVFAISLGTAVFPLLSRYASRNDMPNFRDSLNRALRWALMEGIATGTGLFILAGPILRLIYRHREFTLADAEVATFILRMFVIGMWSYCIYQIISRAFYSMKDSKTPLRITCGFSAIYMVVVSCLVWVDWLGPAAFGLTQSMTFSVNVLVLLWILRRRIGRFGGRQILVSALRSLVCAAAMAAVVLCVLTEMTAQPQTIVADVLELRPVLDLSPQANGLVVAVTVPLGAAMFLLTAWALRAPELTEILGPSVQKLKAAVAKLKEAIRRFRR